MEHGGSRGGSLLGGGSVSGDPKTAGKAVGVGLHLARGPHGEVLVKDVKVGGAAAAAGVQPNSIIHSVNGHTVLGMDTRQVRDQILGESGSTITFHLQPPGSQHVEILSLVRDSVRGVHGVPASPIRNDSSRTAPQQRPPPG
jgi:C-terminal processing protease CtpA/Prc